MTMRKKMGLCFAEGGSVREGANENIEDDVRSRARAAVAARLAAQDAEGAGDASAAVQLPPVRRAAPAAAPAAVYSNEGRGRAKAPEASYSNEGRGREQAPAPKKGFYANALENDPLLKELRGKPAADGPKASYSNEGRTARRRKVLGPASEQRFMGMAKGGSIGFAKGGSIDGCAQRGKTRARG
jgi:hypothetical protein